MQRYRLRKARKKEYIPYVNLSMNLFRYTYFIFDTARYFLYITDIFKKLGYKHENLFLVLKARTNLKKYPKFCYLLDRASFKHLDIFWMFVRAFCIFPLSAIFTTAYLLSIGLHPTITFLLPSFKVSPTVWRYVERFHFYAARWNRVQWLRRGRWEEKENVSLAAFRGIDCGETSWSSFSCVK